MKPLLLILIAAAVPAIALAQPSSKVAWTPDALKFVRNGDASQGKILAETCKSCHGDAGEGVAAKTVDGDTVPAVPTLAGQLATYLFKQLRDYADGSRDDASMGAIAKSLSEQDTADLAAWYASLAAPSASAGKATEVAEKLVKHGDDKRILPACFVCHGASGQGERQDIPALAGQQADYFVNTMLAFKTGARHNDLYSRMRLIAEQLSEQEIKDLAEYYQRLLR